MTQISILCARLVRLAPTDDRATAIAPGRGSVSEWDGRPASWSAIDVVLARLEVRQ